MELNFKKQAETPVNVGDVLVFSNGGAYLVCNDFGYCGYRYVDLHAETVSEYECEVEDIVSTLLSKNNCYYEVIKADDLVLGVK